MGVDFSGELKLGCDVGRSVHKTSKKSLQNILSQELAVEENELWKQSDIMKERYGLAFFVSQDEQNDSWTRIFLGLPLCKCRNRGEPLVDSCSKEDIEKAAERLRTFLEERNCEGNLEMVFELRVF